MNFLIGKNLAIVWLMGFVLLASVWGKTFYGKINPLDIGNFGPRKIGRFWH
jgi:hypothetical protein